MSGLNQLVDICFLQVRGKNQLKKEIEEMKNVPNKTIDFNALHVNEVTKEVEEEPGNPKESARGER